MVIHCVLIFSVVAIEVVLATSDMVVHWVSIVKQASRVMLLTVSALRNLIWSLMVPTTGGIMLTSRLQKLLIEEGIDKLPLIIEKPLIYLLSLSLRQSSEVWVEVRLEVIVLYALMLAPQMGRWLQLVLLHAQPPQVILEHQRVVTVIQVQLVHLVLVHLLLGVQGALPEVGVEPVVLGLEWRIRSGGIATRYYLDKAVVVEIGWVRVVALASELELEIAVTSVACVASVLDLVRDTHAIV
jgi:hypothetical protein